jgi:hypothetical protein
MLLYGSLYLLYALYGSFKYEILVKIFGYSTEYPWIEVGPPLSHSEISGGPSDFTTWQPFEPVTLENYQGCPIHPI